MSDPELGSRQDEKKEGVHSSTAFEIDIGDGSAEKPSWSKRLYLTLQRLDQYGVEARGIERVKSDERISPTWSTWLGLCLLWASPGVGLSVFATGMLGPLYYNLNLAQSIGVIFGGGILGSMCSGYLAIFGKKHGLRALAHCRYTFGYYGAMAMAILNVITEGIFGIQMGILGGQALEVLSKGKLPVAGGIPIVLFASWIIATGGYKFIHYYARVAWVLPFIVAIAMFGVAGDKFSLYGGTEKLDGATQAGLTLSFFAVIFGSSSGWSPVSADYYIYLSESTPDWQVSLMATAGIWLIPTLMYCAGAGYGSILMTNPTWSEWYDANGESSPGLILYSMESLGNVRYFFMFILVVSTMNNNIFNLYSISISMQLLGAWTTYIPRLIWSLVGCIVILVIAIAGRNSIYTILSNTAAIIAYWSIIFFACVTIEHVVFRRRTGYDLKGWDDPKRLSSGYAAGLAFCIGAVGSIIGMGQTWYYGPVASQIGAYGGDLGIELGFIFASISYVVLRSFELKKLGR